MPIDEHRRRNLENWEDRVPIHAASQTYDLAGLAGDPARLTRVIQRDRARMPDLTGKDVVHLQCHIGTDTLSLARLGARSVTGYDFSPSALATARRLAADANTAITYVEGELYDAVDALGPGRFDVVYTGAGALNWLPDIRGWARVAAGLLRPGGVVHLHEGHPMMWALDEAATELVVRYAYFETAEPMEFDEPGTYTDGDTTGLTHTVTKQWNHGLGEIVQAAIDAGLVVTMLQELRYCDWLALPHAMDVVEDDGGAVMREHGDLVPLMYTMQARRLS